MILASRLRATVFTMAGAALICASTAATAQDRPSAFAGGFVADDYFGYVGATLPLPNAQPDRGWAVRGIASAGAYDYTRGADQIDAEYVNVELALVYQRSGPWGYWNAGVGPRYSSTDLSMPDPVNPREGEQIDAVVSADGARYNGLWRVAGYGSYAFDIEDYYVRGEVTRAIRPGGVRLGVEAMLEGDPNYDRQSLGAVVAFQPTSTTEIRFSVGARTADGRSDQAYFAVGASRSF